MIKNKRVLNRYSSLVIFSIVTFCFSIFLFTSCNNKKSESNNTNTDDAKFQQYYIRGEQLYLNNCSNCHQKNGTGLGLLYPPLNKSDYVDQNLEQVVCLIRNGKKGDLIVNGKNFNKAMPGIPSLTDIEIAEIATYLYNTWNRDRGLIDVKQTSTVLQQCQSQ